MKRNKRLVILVSFIIAILAVGCGKIERLSPKEKTHKMLTELQNYEAEMQITFTNNKKSSTIKMKQFYEMNGQFEITLSEPEHVKDYKAMCNGETITEYNPVTDKSVQVQITPVKNQVLFGTFVHNYLETQNISYHEEEVGSGALVVELSIPGNYKYMATEKVWFDDQGTPLKMEIYGQDGELAIKIEILSFSYNPQIK